MDIRETIEFFGDNESVYFILQKEDDVSYVKIGKTKNGEEGVIQRYNAFSRCNPRKGILLGYLENSEERYWLDQFKEWKLPDKEEIFYVFIHNLPILMHLHLKIPKKTLQKFKEQNSIEGGTQELIKKYRADAFDFKRSGIQNIDEVYEIYKSDYRKADKVLPVLLNILNNSGMFSDRVGQYIGAPFGVTRANKDHIDDFGFPIKGGEHYISHNGRFPCYFRISLSGAYRMYYKNMSKEWLAKFKV